jgi:alpha-glucosidase (family GH31 glycosyl hydrolase)
MEDYIPVFVRGGAFIPMIKTIQNTTKYSLDTFDLHFYFDETIAKSSGKVYNDNGLTANAFEKGEYEILNFNSINANKVLTLKLSGEIGKNYTSNKKEVSVIVHNIIPKRIVVNGQEQIYKTFHNPMEIPVTWEKGTNPEIKIEY